MATANVSAHAGSRRPSPLLGLALFAVFAAACPGKRHVPSPEPPIPQDGDQAALRRFEQTRSQFRDSEAGGSVKTTEAFESIAREYPDDPIVPHALLYAGMSAVRAGEYAAAVENLDKLVSDPAADPRLVARGRLYRGLARNYQGDHAAAIGDLQAGEEAIDANDANERGEWLAAMAVALRESGQVVPALPYFDRWYDEARPAEKAFIVAQVRAAAAALAEAQVEPAYRGLADRKGPAAAFLGMRLASIYSTRGQTQQAAEIRSQTAEARKRLGLVPPRPAGARAGDPSRLGGVMPLSGKRNRLGERTGSGLALAASFGERAGGGARADGWPRRFDLMMRDSASDAARAARAVEELDAEDVIAVVGPVDRRATAEAAAAAGRLGVPLVTLSQRPQASDSPYVFHVVHSATMRAEALARYAVGHGVKDFAIFRPENAYGRVVGDAFAAEVERLGGSVIVTAGYPPGETSINKHLGKLKKPYQALFVPDSARRLALVAPALAAAFLTPRPLGEKGHGRSILLLSTAEGLTDRFLQQAGRHAWGAVLAPGFYADTRDPRIGRFVARYLRAFNREPTAFDAYAFDAALVVRAAVEEGAGDRAELAESLAGIEVDGLTGKIRFDSGHRRADDGVLFEVKQLPESSDYIIEAQREGKD